MFQPKFACYLWKGMFASPYVRSTRVFSNKSIKTTNLGIALSWRKGIFQVNGLSEAYNQGDQMLEKK